MRRRTPRRAGLLALLVVLTAAAGGAPAASAAAPTLRVLEEGAVVAGGAGIVSDVVITCDAGARQRVRTQVTQRQADGSLVTATGSRLVTCTGAEQVVRVLVTTGNGVASGAPFSPGKATVRASLPLPGQPVTASRTVRTPAGVKDVALTGLDVDAALPSSARLEADGAGVKVHVAYRCPPGAGGTLSARLVQRTPTGAVMSTPSAARFSCTGAARSVGLTFHAGPVAFEPGDALLVVEGTSRPSAAGSESTAYAHRTLSLTTSAVATPPGERAPGEGSLRIRQAAGAQAGGIGFAVDLVLTCTGGGPQSYALHFRVTQRQPDGSLLHDGANHARWVTCTGAPQVVRMVADTAHDGGTFRPGVAFVTAEGEHRDRFRGGRLQGARTVQVSDATMDDARLTGSGLSATLPARTTLAADGTTTVRVPHRCASGDTGRLQGTLVLSTSADTVTTIYSNKAGDYSSQQLTCTGATQYVTLTFAPELFPRDTEVFGDFPEASPALLQVYGTLNPASPADPGHPYESLTGHRTVTLG